MSEQTSFSGGSGCTPSNPKFDGSTSGTDKPMTAEEFFGAASVGFDLSCSTEAAKTGATGFNSSFGGTVRAAVSELTTKAGFNFFQIAQGLYILMDIVQKVGPDVMKIVEQFKQAWEKMKGG